jgi:hypothetical protein
MKYVIVATAIRTLIALAAITRTLIASAIRRNSSSPTYTLVMVNLRKKLRYGVLPYRGKGGKTRRGAEARSA